MPQSLVKNLVHLVYSTKHRKPWIPEDVRDPLLAYQAGIFRQWESPTLVIGGVKDHVHALFSLSKNYALKKIVEEVKKGSSKWMKMDEGSGNKDFQWQSGYAGFSVSQSNVEEVTNYLARRSRNQISIMRMATKSHKKHKKTDSDPEPPYLCLFVPFCGQKTFVRENLRAAQRN